MTGLLFAAAAPAAATPSAGIPVWLTLVLSSAFISALVNVVSSVISKWWENRREDKKERDRVAHIYFDIALQLEQFAQTASTRIDEIYDALGAYQRDLDESALDGIDILAFSFLPPPSWDQLPITFAATVKAFPIQLSNSRTWIEAGPKADHSEGWELERQRLAFYGRKACQLALELRQDLGLKDDSSTVFLAVRFHEEIAKWHRAHDEMEKLEHPLIGTSLIPELSMEFSVRSASEQPQFLAEALRRPRQHQVL